jgi:hypothetical protein
MLVPHLIPAASALPVAPAGAVALAGQNDFQLAYDAAAGLAAVDPQTLTEAAIFVSDPTASAGSDPDMPMLADDVAREMGADLVLLTTAEPAKIAGSPDQKGAVPVLPAGDPRLPVKITQHSLIQMVFDQPAAPAAPPPADAADAAALVTVLPGARQPVSAEEIARAGLVGTDAGPTKRETAIKEGAPVARITSTVAAQPTIAPSPVAAQVPSSTPLSTRDIPEPLPPATVMDRTVPMPPVATAIKRPELVIPIVKGLDPKVDAASGGDESTLPFAPAGDTASGVAKTSEAQSAPGVVRHVAQQLAVTITQTTGQPTEIAPNPEELGRVRMSMSLTDGTLMLHINAERPETADLLRRHIDTLAQEFRSLGYNDISFDFGDGRTQDEARHDAGPLTEHAEDATETQAPEQTGVRQPRGGLDLRL